MMSNGPLMKPWAIRCGNKRTGEVFIKVSCLKLSKEHVSQERGGSIEAFQENS